MGKFTVRDDPEVDRVVAAHLDAIVKKVVAAGGETVRAVLITGGFGRGEGSVIIDPQRGPRPLNDYDLVVVTRSGRRLDPVFADAARELKEELGVAVDVGIFRERQLPRLAPTILAYEIQRGHHLLWGDARAVDFPAFRTDEIPLEQGTELLFNRGMSLLRSVIAREEEWPAPSRRQAAIHIQKAIQAWGDSALLLAGRYGFRYSDRRDRVASLSEAAVPPVRDFRTRVRQAVEMKLRPVPTDPDPLLSDALAETVRDHERVFRWFEERRLRRTIEGWSRYDQPRLRRTAPPPNFGEFLRNAVRNIRLYRGAVSWRGLFRSPKDRLVGVFPRVLFGSAEEGDAALRGIGLCAGIAGRKAFLRRWH